MSNATICIQRAQEAEPLRRPLLRSVIQSLDLPAGSHGLDAGCGIGLQALLLAEAVGPAGHVTAVDLAPALLVFADEQVEKAGYTGRITVCAGDVDALPFDDDTFDWVWSADCIGYPLGDLAPALAELVRVVRPGGSVILLGWSSQQLLPGYPLLEARLNATCSGYLPFLQGQEPALNFLRALRPLRQAGLVEVKAQTFAGEVQSPLSPAERIALASLFAMLWGERQPGVAPAAWREYRRLCEPGSADFILDVDGYYAFFTYTLFRGRVPYP
jgi:demethylmenaquinone methyltransferase/2-methoxy-6-polyprenyl-1,4-benzoquinol methylase